MSADNGLYVCRCVDRKDLTGVFYYCVSVDNPPQWYTTANAEEVYTDGIAAIVAAHRRDAVSNTEYSVSVQDEVWAGTQAWVDRFKWEGPYV